HQELFNCAMGAVKSIHGDKWGESLPPLISGHIHDYQRLQENIWYTGTPRQIGFGDRTNKSVSEFLFSKDKGVTEIRHYLKGKNKHSIHLQCKEASNYTPPTGSIIKLVVSGTSAELHVFKQHSSQRLEQ